MDNPFSVTQQCIQICVVCVGFMLCQREHRHQLCGCAAISGAMAKN